MKKLFILLALFGVLAVGCEELFPTEQSPNATPIFSTEGESSYIVDAEGEEIAVMVTTNIGYSVVIPEDAEEWLSVADTRALRVDTLTFIVAPNDTTVERTTIVKFVDDNNNNNILQTISFTQNAAAQSESVCPNNEIWYTNGSTTEATTPYKTDAFGANIVSNTYDATKECWVIKFDGEVTTIRQYAFYRRDNLTSVTIGDSVTTIGYEAFYECRSLTSVTIGDSVTTIGNYAFAWCISLKSVTIPDSVTTIGKGAFYCCDSLTSVTIGDSVTTIGEEAFYSCDSLTELKGNCVSDDGRCIIFDGVLSYFIPTGLTEYTISDSVTTIGDYAFYHCDSLISVTIPDSVTTIGDEAFGGCHSLTSVTIPDSVTTIGNGAFSVCGSLQEFNGKFASEDDRCLIIDGVLNSFAPAGLTEYTIPDSVTTIGYCAFYKYSSLTSVTIPDSVTTIGNSAFEYCHSLTSVTIPDSVTTIGDYAFYRCNSLTSVTIGDSVTTIGSHAFSGCSSLTSATIPDSVTTIGEWAFGESDSLTSVTIGDSVTEIGECAFNCCSSLTSVYISNISAWCNISFSDWYSNPFSNGCNLYLNNELVTDLTIPDSVTTIGEYAFCGCSLTSVTIGDSVTTVGENAFCGCSLTSVIIPNSVTTIGWYAFENCSSLTSVYCKAITPPAGSYGMFDGNASGRKIYVPMESVNTYKRAEGWWEYASAIVGYNF